MRVHSGHGFNPHVPAIAAPQSVRLPDDHLEGGKQAYSLRGSVRKDVAQVDERVVQNLVAGCRADRVASSSRFACGEWKGGGGRQLGQVSEHGVELVRAELARDQFYFSQVRQIQDADRVDEIENERVRFGGLTLPELVIPTRGSRYARRHLERGQNSPRCARWPAYPTYVATTCEIYCGTKNSTVEGMLWTAAGSRRFSSGTLGNPDWCEARITSGMPIGDSDMSIKNGWLANPEDHPLFFWRQVRWQCGSQQVSHWGG